MRGHSPIGASSEGGITPRLHREEEPPLPPVPERSASARQIATTDTPLRGRFPGIHIPDPFHLYGFSDVSLKSGPPERPVRIVMLTSIRDVGVAEGVGDVRLRGNRECYLKGAMETLFEAVAGGELAGYVDIVGIITDDLPKDLAQHNYPALPTVGKPWICPLSMENGEGVPVTLLTENIPSRFRALRLSDIDGRKAAKFEFEENVFHFMRERGADVLLSDHYMAQIDYLFNKDYFPLWGRVLNTHCGPIRSDHPYPLRGREPYRDAIRLANEAHGPRLPPFFTGATLHCMSRTIDDGPVIAEVLGTTVFPDDTEAELISRLYRTSKEQVILAGLRHYATNIFPHLASHRCLEFVRLEAVKE